MTNQTNHITDELLVKHLLGEATADEQEQVERWLNADPANKKYYEHFRLIWEQSKLQLASSTVDEDQAWQRLRDRMHRQPAVVKRFSWLRVAALVAVIAGAGWIAYSLLWQGPKEQIVQSFENVMTDTLTDGSVVTLNKNSLVTFEDRKATLVGEAFFRVAHNKEKPFTIHVNDVVVKVIGTAFNVRSSSGTTEVIVETGIVQVTHRNRTIQLTAGEKTIVHVTDTLFTKETEQDKLYNHYRTKEFVCDNTPLWKLATVLNAAYNAQIVVEEPARNITITTTFNNESLDRILEVIDMTLDVSIERKNDTIIIR